MLDDTIEAHNARVARLAHLRLVRPLYKEAIIQEMNKPPKFRTMLVELKQDWYDLEDEMFRIEVELRHGL